MKNKKNLITKALFGVFLIILLAIEVAHAIWRFDDDVYLMLSRFAGGGACIAFMLEFSFVKVFSPIGNKKALLLLLTLPGFVIAVNNFPFVSFFAGDCSINAEIGSIAFFALKPKEQNVSFPLKNSILLPKKCEERYVSCIFTLWVNRSCIRNCHSL